LLSRYRIECEELADVHRDEHRHLRVGGEQQVLLQHEQLAVQVQHFLLQRLHFLVQALEFPGGRGCGRIEHDVGLGRARCVLGQNRSVRAQRNDEDGQGSKHGVGFLHSFSSSRSFSV
jgi:hypothetical protein